MLVLISSRLFHDHHRRDVTPGAGAGTVAEPAVVSTPPPKVARSPSPWDVTYRPLPEHPLSPSSSSGGGGGGGGLAGSRPAIRSSPLMFMLRDHSSSTDKEPAVSGAATTMRRFGSSGMRRSPALPSSMPDSRAPVCVRRSECPVCYSALHLKWVSMCVDGKGRPTCKHFYHTSCLQLLRKPACLVDGCGASFQYRRSLPNILDEQDKWFSFVDFDGQNACARHDVYKVLCAQLPLDAKRLDDYMRQAWHRWDKAGDDKITRESMFRPKTGLMAALQRKRETLRPDVDDVGNPLREVAPDIRWDASLWFDHYDDDHSRMLSRDEVIRGLVHSFDAAGDVPVASIIRDVIQAVWPVFDLDGSGEIDRNEFLKPKEGLADSIVASLTAKPRDLAIKRRSSASSSSNRSLVGSPTATAAAAAAVVEDVKE